MLPEVVPFTTWPGVGADVPDPLDEDHHSVGNVDRLLSARVLLPSRRLEVAGDTAVGAVSITAGAPVVPGLADGHRVPDVHLAFAEPSTQKRIRVSPMYWQPGLLTRSPVVSGSALKLAHRAPFGSNTGDPLPRKHLLTAAVRVVTGTFGQLGEYVVKPCLELGIAIDQGHVI